MSICVLANQYNDFLHKVGCYDQDSFAEIQRICSPSFRIIANGAKLVSGRDKLQKQLEDIRELAGGWHVEVKQQLPTADSQHCVIRYHWVTKAIGTLDIMALFTSVDGELIEEVDVVFYKIPEVANGSSTFME